MQRLCSADELGERWSLLLKGLALLGGQVVTSASLALPSSSRAGASAAAFPTTRRTVALAVIVHLTAPISGGVEALDGYIWTGRSGHRHRLAMIDHLAVAALDKAAEARLTLLM